VNASVDQHRLTRLQSLIKERVDFALENLEVKHTEGDSMILYRGHPDLIFPTRIWDGVRLYGTKLDEGEISQKTSIEIINNPKFSVKFADRLRTHRVIMKTGVDKYK
jgi:hypothetical protein